jgi:hypothetical protein
MRFETHPWAQWQPAVGAPVTSVPSDAGGWTTNEVLTLVIAGLAVMVAVVGVILTNRRSKANEEMAREALQDARLGRQEVDFRSSASERTAREALNDARLARQEAVELALWTSTLEAVNRLAGFDPAREPVGSRLQDLRVRLMLLGDHFDDWEGFDTWLAEEHLLGTNLGTEAMETFNPRATLLGHVARVQKCGDWAMAFSTNLRRLRKHGFKPKVVAHLREQARKNREAMYAQYGWGPIPEGFSGFELLDENQFDD